MMSDPEAVYGSIRDEIDRVLIGNEHVVEGLTIAALTGGHVLSEGVPGIAKTTAANLFARASTHDYR
jgi:MoxR-like ATPase